LRHICVILAPSLAEHVTLSGCPCAPLTLRNCYRFLPRYAKQAERLVRKFTAVWTKTPLFPEYRPTPLPSAGYLQFLDQETKAGGHLHFGSMRSAHQYQPDALSNLLQAARGPEAFRWRNAISRIYTCEGALRLAEHVTHEPGLMRGAA
jgi:hypothetical protein